MYTDKILICNRCGGKFVFAADEQQFFAEKGFHNAPVRCPACRKARMLAMERQGIKVEQNPPEMFRPTTTVSFTCAGCGKPHSQLSSYAVPKGRTLYCPECYLARFPL